MPNRVTTNGIDSSYPTMADLPSNRAHFGAVVLVEDNAQPYVFTPQGWRPIMVGNPCPQAQPARSRPYPGQPAGAR